MATAAELDRAEAALRAAQAQLAQARQAAEQATEQATTALSYSTLPAPFTGRVIDRLADPGGTVMPDQPLINA